MQKSSVSKGGRKMKFLSRIGLRCVCRWQSTYKDRIRGWQSRWEEKSEKEAKEKEVRKLDNNCPFGGVCEAAVENIKKANPEKRASLLLFLFPFFFFFNVQTDRQQKLDQLIRIWHQATTA